MTNNGSRTDDIGIVVGHALRRLRKAAGKSQADVATAIAMSQRQISAWELGSALPGIDQMFAIERVLGLPQGAILLGAGLVREAQGIELAILADAGLTDKEKDALLIVIDGLRRRNRTRRPKGPMSGT